MHIQNMSLSFRKQNAVPPVIKEVQCNQSVINQVVYLAYGSSAVVFAVRKQSTQQ